VEHCPPSAWNAVRHGVEYASSQVAAPNDGYLAGISANSLTAMGLRQTCSRASQSLTLE
jgi:hypothetical protein